MPPPAEKGSADPLYARILKYPEGLVVLTVMTSDTSVAAVCVLRDPEGLIVPMIRASDTA